MSHPDESRLWAEKVDAFRCRLLANWENWLMYLTEYAGEERAIEAIWIIDEITMKLQSESAKRLHEENAEHRGAQERCLARFWAVADAADDKVAVRFRAKRPN